MKKNLNENRLLTEQLASYLSSHHRKCHLWSQKMVCANFHDLFSTHKNSHFFSFVVLQYFDVSETSFLPFIIITV